MSVTSITRHQPAKPVTTAEVLDACEAALATSKAIGADLAQLMVRHMRHVMNLATIPGPAARPVLSIAAQLDVAQADEFAAELEKRAQGADLPHAMYLVGLAEGHLQNLSDLIHATTGLPG
jgi:hypothetical protein